MLRETIAQDIVCTLEQMTLLALSNRNLLRGDRPDEARIDSVIHQLGSEALEMLEEEISPINRPKRSRRKPKLR
jgi:hypothetical protein